MRDSKKYFSELAPILSSLKRVRRSLRSLIERSRGGCGAGARSLLFFFFCATFSVSVFAAELPQWHGFVETSFGYKLDDDGLTKHHNYNMLESRLQLKSSYFFSQEGLLTDWQGVLRVKGDLTVDGYYGAKTAGDLREFNLALRPTDRIDLKIGRQILTWGTGDYLFINDVFPKDYVSFYIGRDDEYLKAPSNALKVSFYPDMFNVDFVVVPEFEPNIIDSGDRLSFFDSFQGGIAGRASDRFLARPPRTARNFEYALRVYRNFGAVEAAFYAFRGFDKMPRSYQDEARRRLFYQRQHVHGVSARTPFLSGLFNAEFGYIYSMEDSSGNNRLVENSMIKFLAGYEKDLGNDLKAGLQYYYEQKLNYGAYKKALLPRDYFWDRSRQLITQRVTKMFKGQTVVFSLFNFYSPDDHDGYARCSLSYAATDQFKVVVGANLPWGEDDITDFGQMRGNKNIFVRLRYSF